MLWKCIEDVWELTGALQARTIKKGSFVDESSVHLQTVEVSPDEGAETYDFMLRIDCFGDIPIEEFKRCFVLADEEEISPSM